MQNYSSKMVGASVKIDHEYLKGLLVAFEESDSPVTNIRELKEKGFDYNVDQFVFHMRLLDDRGLISQPDGGFGFGLQVSVDGFYSWAVIPIRLTAEGHDFLEAIRNKEVWSMLKTGFKDASIGTLVTVSKELFNRALAKQLDKYFE
ncbi:Uncharacterised protein [Klebsiella pneumoniae]|nr:Uncharacterised protein [Klebsiella pneumoniae]VTN87706.1 Uncharacterised protein [Klebsiella pneumoniae]